MDFSSFIFLLARQRSGTHVLKGLLKQHPDIFATGEFFDPRDTPARPPGEPATNYFDFLREYAGGDVSKLHPTRTETIFSDYLGHLRGLYDERYLVLDVKYNSTHHFVRAWQGLNDDPCLFHLIKKHRIKVLHLTRRNYLRYLISLIRAQETGVFLAKDDVQAGKSGFAVTLPAANLLRKLGKLAAENARLSHAFSLYPDICAFDYADLYPDASGAPSRAVLENITRWLELPAIEFDAPAARKQSLLSLRDTIENYEEIAGILAGTEYAYCLEDEPIYLPD